MKICTHVSRHRRSLFEQKVTMYIALRIYIYICIYNVQGTGSLGLIQRSFDDSSIFPLVRETDSHSSIDMALEERDEVDPLSE